MAATDELFTAYKRVMVELETAKGKRKTELQRERKRLQAAYVNDHGGDGNELDEIVCGSYP